jgi:hypothetical protein
MKITPNMSYYMALLMLVGFTTSCTHLINNNQSSGLSKKPHRLEQWERQPVVQIQDALRKALAYLQEQRQDLTKGYRLQAERGEDYWWFDFRLLPLSPDNDISVQVFDSGKIEAAFLAPPKKRAPEKM